MATKHSWIIEPSAGTSYTVTAEKYEFDTLSGRHIFSNGDEIVANLLNVSVRRKASTSD